MEARPAYAERDVIWQHERAKEGSAPTRDSCAEARNLPGKARVNRVHTQISLYGPVDAPLRRQAQLVTQAVRVAVFRCNGGARARPLVSRI